MLEGGLGGALHAFSGTSALLFSAFWVLICGGSSSHLLLLLVLLQEDRRGWEALFSESPSKPFCEAHFLTVVRDLVHMGRARTTGSTKLSKITLAPMSSLGFHLQRAAWVLEYWSAAFNSCLGVPDIQEWGWESDGSPKVMSAGDRRIWFDMWRPCACSQGARSCASARCACHRRGEIGCSMLCG